METIKSLLTELLQNPMHYSAKNWVTVVVILLIINEIV